MEFFKEPFIVRLQILRQGKKKQQVSFRLEADFKREIFGVAKLLKPSLKRRMR